ncbi:MAG: hypothetical protein LCH99_04470 [Proteobacteria bacterium]|nr:hypothetical protein [Pseudomonadota bacterium]
MIYEFDRYVSGRLMAEGVTIERARSFQDAAATAARIASRGPNGETPVLVLRSPTAATSEKPSDAILSLLDTPTTFGTDEACPGEHQEVLDAIQSHNSGEDE